MIGTRNFAFYSLLLHVLAVVVTTSARSTAGLVQVSQNVLDDGPEYEMMITPDEEDRIVELLGPSYLETGLIATKVTGPPRHCAVCGKQTEFVDWVFTALARGIHSPEFIVESLKLGNSPKKLGHDVYCSRCGHLTHFRDATGEEGGAPYIALASPYDRATRTFATSVFAKREVTEARVLDSAVAVDETSVAEAAPVPPVWRTRWTRKREDEVEEAEADADAALPPVWRTHWTRKRSEDGEDACPGSWSAHQWQVKAVEGEQNTTLNARCIFKRDEAEVEAEAGAEVDAALPPVWRTHWTRKREDEDEVDAALPPVWRTHWTRKRDESGVDEDALPPVWRTHWTRKRDEAEVDTLPPIWRTRWARKREDKVDEHDAEDTSPSADTLPPIWRTRWTRKRDEAGIDEAALPPVWRTRWTRKRDETDVDTLPPVWRTHWTRKREDSEEVDSESALPFWVVKRDEPRVDAAPHWSSTWYSKRDEDEVDTLPPVWRTLWTRKRGEDSEDACPGSWSAHQWQVKAVEGEHEAALNARCIFKREEYAVDAAAPPPVWRTHWTRKREDEAEDKDAEEITPSAATLPPVWRTHWTRKRDEDDVDTLPPVWRTHWTRKREDAEVDTLPPVWRTLWTRKRGEDGEDACPGSWSAHQWQVKAVEGERGAALDARCIFKRGEELD